MPLDQIRRYAEQVNLCLVAVADDPSVHIGRGTRHLGEPVTDESTGARLRQRDRMLLFQEQSADDFFHGFGTLCENPFMQTTAYRFRERRPGPRRVLRGAGVRLRRE